MASPFSDYMYVRIRKTYDENLKSSLYMYVLELDHVPKIRCYMLHIICFISFGMKVRRVNRKKAPLRKIFSTFALYLQAPDVLKMGVTDMQRFVLIC